MNRQEELLGKELEVKKDELNQMWHNSTLEKIFIENRIYRNIEDKESWEDVLNAINKGLEPFINVLKKDVNDDDIVRLTEIKIKRISKYDKDRLNDTIVKLNEELDKTLKNLKNIVEYTIDYYYNILNKYGKGRQRKTEIIKFDTIKVKSVAANNVKLYVNRKEGFIGYGIRKEELVCNCSDIDDIITFCADGSYKIVKIQDKVFVGKNIVLTQIWKKSDKRMVFNAAYLDSKTGFSYVKRFQVTSATKEKIYNIGKSEKVREIVQKLSFKYSDRLSYFSSLEIFNQYDVGEEIISDIERFRNLIETIQESGEREILADQIKSFISSSEQFNYIYGEYDYYISLSNFLISLLELNELEYSMSVIDKIEEQLIRRVSVFSNIDEEEQVYYLEGITSDINQYSRLINQIEIYDIDAYNKYDKNLKDMLARMIE